MSSRRRTKTKRSRYWMRPAAPKQFESATLHALIMGFLKKKNPVEFMQFAGKPLEYAIRYGNTESLIDEAVHAYALSSDVSEVAEVAYQAAFPRIEPLALLAVDVALHVAPADRVAATAIPLLKAARKALRVGNDRAATGVVEKILFGKLTNKIYASAARHDNFSSVHAARYCAEASLRAAADGLGAAAHGDGTPYTRSGLRFSSALSRACQWRWMDLEERKMSAPRGCEKALCDEVRAIVPPEMVRRAAERLFLARPNPSRRTRR